MLGWLFDRSIDWLVDWVLACSRLLQTFCWVFKVFSQKSVLNSNFFADFSRVSRKATHTATLDWSWWSCASQRVIIVRATKKRGVGAASRIARGTPVPPYKYALPVDRNVERSSNHDFPWKHGTELHGELFEKNSFSPWEFSPCNSANSFFFNCTTLSGFFSWKESRLQVCCKSLSPQRAVRSGRIPCIGRARSAGNELRRHGTTTLRASTCWSWKCCRKTTESSSMHHKIQWILAIYWAGTCSVVRLSIFATIFSPKKCRRIFSPLHHVFAWVKFSSIFMWHLNYFVSLKV